MSDSLAPLGGPGDGQTVVVRPERRRRLFISQLTKRLAARARARVLSERDVVLWRGGDRSPGAAGKALSALLSGVIHYSATAEVPLVSVRRQLGLEPSGPAHFGSGGGVRQRCTRDDRNVLLRLGVSGSASDPSHHFAALEAITDPRVPEAISSGSEGEIHWTVEGFLSGSQPRVVDLGVVAQVGELLRRLPEPATARRFVSMSFGQLVSEGFEVEIRPLMERCREDDDLLPSVMVHGDMWAGNLLFEEGELRGVVDWDSWSTGPPGIDLLHLWAESIRRRRRLSYGELIQSEFWRSDPVSRSVEEHLRERGVPVGSVPLDTLARLWWWRTVSGAAARNRSAPTRETWIRRNVVDPARFWIARLGSDL